MSATFGSKDIGIRKSEFVAKTQFLCRPERNWVFATDSDFLIPRSLQLNAENLRYF